MSLLLTLMLLTKSGLEASRRTEAAALNKAIAEEADAEATVAKNEAEVHRLRALNTCKLDEVRDADVVLARSLARLHEGLKTNAKNVQQLEAAHADKRVARDQVRAGYEALNLGPMIDAAERALAESRALKIEKRNARLIAEFKHARVLAYVAGDELYDAKQELQRSFDAAVGDYKAGHRRLLEVLPNYRDDQRMPEPRDYEYHGAAPEPDTVKLIDAVVIARHLDRERDRMFEVGERVQLPETYVAENLMVVLPVAEWARRERERIEAEKARVATEEAQRQDPWFNEQKEELRRAREQSLAFQRAMITGTNNG